MKRKDAGFNLRVERELRDAFTEACQLQGESAAAILREFMQSYVVSHRPPTQGDLFDQLDGGELNTARGPMPAGRILKAPPNKRLG